MRIYISIPITGYDEAQQRAHAQHLSNYIRALGHEVVNPFDAPKPFEYEYEYLSEKEKYAYYMGFDIADLLRSDAAFFAFGWQMSKGCLLGNRAAEIYGIKRYYDLTKIPAFE